MANPHPKGFKEALAVFRNSAKNVPAYKAFLAAHHIDPDRIHSFEDFAAVPPTDKLNYLRAYPYEDLFPNRIIPPVVSMSSGSSGTPFYWPRAFAQEERGGEIHEIIVRDALGIHQNEKTLVIICFSMGTWIAGAFTASSMKWMAQKGYHLAILTPGIEKEDALAILRDFAPKFKRVILAGYPPFLMDIITAAHERKIPVKNLSMRLLIAGENFSETWRATLHGLCGISDRYGGSISIYGTADADILGHESPLTIFLRIHADKSKKFFSALLGETSFLPTLVHYHPEYKFFECIRGELAFTADAGIPLVRYNIKDQGLLISSTYTKEVIRNFHLDEEVRRRKMDKWHLPMLTLAGRKDVSVTFYALNIYPENIKRGLEDRTISKLVTGKFVARTHMSRDQRDQTLIISVELRPGVRAGKGKEELVKEVIFQHLLNLNSEYRKLHSAIRERAFPEIVLVPFGDSSFVVRASKHHWVGR